MHVMVFACWKSDMEVRTRDWQLISGEECFFGAGFICQRFPSVSDFEPYMDVLYGAALDKSTKTKTG